MELINMNTASSSLLYPLSVKGDCLMIALIQYPNSGNWLYFTLNEIAASGGECIAFPGDRDFYTTAEDAARAAHAYYNRADIVTGRESIYKAIDTILAEQQITAIDDTPALVSFDMRDPYMYVDIAGARICVDENGGACILSKEEKAPLDNLGRIAQIAAVSPEVALSIIDAIHAVSCDCEMSTEELISCEEDAAGATDTYANLYRPFPLRNASALYAEGCDPITAQYLATGELPG